jgi:hypothetical protein
MKPIAVVGIVVGSVVLIGGSLLLYTRYTNSNAYYNKKFAGMGVRAKIKGDTEFPTADNSKVVKAKDGSIIAGVMQGDGRILVKEISQTVTGGGNVNIKVSPTLISNFDSSSINT